MLIDDETKCLGFLNILVSCLSEDLIIENAHLPLIVIVKKLFNFMIFFSVLKKRKLPPIRKFNELITNFLTECMQTFFLAYVVPIDSNVRVINRFLNKRSKIEMPTGKMVLFKT